MRLESRARATRKIFGIASRAREWGAKGRAIVSWVRRVEVGSVSGDILRGRERKRRYGGWAGWDGSWVAGLLAPSLTDPTTDKSRAETGDSRTCGSHRAQPGRKAAERPSSR